MNDVTMTTQKTLKTALYNGVQVKVNIIGNSNEVTGSCITRRSEGFIVSVLSLGDGIEVLVGLHVALGTLLKHLEKCGIEIPMNERHKKLLGFDTALEMDALPKPDYSYMDCMEERA